MMNIFEYIDDVENRYQVTLPSLYKQLAKDNMLDWGIAQANWYQEVYPQLLKNPPLLLTACDFELSSPDDLMGYADEFLPNVKHTDYYYVKPEFQDRLVTFAICGDGDFYVFYYADDKDAEPQILRICHDDDSEFVAKNLQEFIVYKLLEIATRFEDGDIEVFRHQLLTQLQTHRPYLSQSQADSLLAIYQAEFKPNRFGSWYLLDDLAFDDWRNRLIPFDKQDEKIEIFEFD